jgi:hypothetical protein
MCLHTGKRNKYSNLQQMAKKKEGMVAIEKRGTVQHYHFCRAHISQKLFDIWIGGNSST